MYIRSWDTGRHRITPSTIAELTDALDHPLDHPVFWSVWTDEAPWVERLRSLLEAPSPAVLTTYRKAGSAHTVPVWYRWTGEAFEVVIAKAT